MNSLASTAEVKITSWMTYKYNTEFSSVWDYVLVFSFFLCPQQFEVYQVKCSAQTRRNIHVAVDDAYAAWAEDRSHPTATCYEAFLQNLLTIWE